MARQSQIDRAISKLDADIEAIEKKAREDVTVLQAARKRLVEAQKTQPKRKAKQLPGSVMRAVASDKAQEESR